MPPKGSSKEPIVLGRRNCLCCRVWRIVATDFSRTKHDTPDLVCKVCRGKLKKHNEYPMEVRIRMIRMNLSHRLYKLPPTDAELEAIKDRLEKKERRLERKIRNINSVLPKERTTYNGDRLVPLMPFRLWLLARLQKEGIPIAVFADRVHKDESLIRRWMEGIVWETQCNPQPIHSITINNVDEVLTRSGELPTKLNELYPWEN